MTNEDILRAAFDTVGWVGIDSLYPMSWDKAVEIAGEWEDIGEQIVTAAIAADFGEANECYAAMCRASSMFADRGHYTHDEFIKRYGTDDVDAVMHQCKWCGGSGAVSYGEPDRLYDCDRCKERDYG